MRYPVEIVPYDPLWPAAYERERERIDHVLHGRILRYEHMGSTAVPGMDAKPIIDISCAVPSLQSVEPLLPLLVELGYEQVESNSPDRMDFCRRGDSDRPTHILHFMEENSGAWLKPLIFRDALRRDEALRREYAELKRSLAQAVGDDNRRYNVAKSAFINGVVEANL